jgi:hypothetical protein
VIRHAKSGGKKKKRFRFSAPWRASSMSDETVRDGTSPTREGRAMAPGAIAHVNVWSSRSNERRFNDRPGAPIPQPIARRVID